MHLILHTERFCHIYATVLWKSLRNVTKYVKFDLIDLILYVPSIIFQL